ncbi:component of SufBCD Fe-S cluster assembly scaffold [Gammaproteobacteria bacterium]|nr:component of SufBCD Fe-S cluster assembly scaffold [Gammaproteobacteria bacterium]
MNNLTKLSENIRLERWKQTPLKEILKTNWQPSTHQVDPILSQISLPKDAILITLGNGKIDSRWFDDRQLPEGMIVRMLDQTVDIQIFKDTTITRPIVLHHIAEAHDLPLNIDFTINITCEAHAKISVLMVESGFGEYLITPKINIDLHESAQCQWLRASLNSAESVSLSTLHVNQAATSSINLLSYQSRGKIVRADIKLDLVGDGCVSELSGLNIGKGKQNLGHVIDINHQAPNCTSTQQIKNLLKDQANTLFDGKIQVFKDAQKTDAQQITRSILLNEKTRAITIPRLEIYANDVKCTHGATVGFLEPDHIFYLQSRGIPKNIAKQMLMQAFAMEITEQVQNEIIKKWLTEVIVEDIKELI